MIQQSFRADSEAHSEYVSKKHYGKGVPVMATQIISSGLTPVSPGATGAGESLLVLSGGTALSAAIIGGTETIDGTDSSGTVTAHGVQGVYAGGLAVGTVVDDEAVQTVLAGGSAQDADVTASGTQLVWAGGSVQDSLVDSGGFAWIFSTGSTRDGTIANGGTLALEGLGNGTGQAIAQDMSVQSGGFVVVSSDGAMDGGTIASGGIVFALSNGTVSGMDVASGGYLVAAPGAMVSNDTGGTVVATGILVLQGTEAVTLSAPTTATLDLGSGAQAFILPQGTALGDTLSDGAAERIYAGGAASGATLSGSYQIISAGGFASGTVLDQGAVQYVFSSGSAMGTVVNSGFSIVDYGGTATGVTVESGGNQSVDGVAIATILGSGGGQTIDDFGTAISTTIDSGGFAFVYVSSVISAATIGGGGYAVLVGGTALGVTVDSGGTLIAMSGAKTSGVDVESGGLMVLLPKIADSGAALASGPTVISGGAVISGDAVIVISGAADVTLYSGSGAAPALGSGASSFVLSGGLQSGAVISNNGSSAVFAGGTAVDTTIDAGGLLLVDSGAVISGPITFSGISGTLKTAETTLPGAFISGFAPGDIIDLPTVSGADLSASLTSAGVLAVTSAGTTVASFQLSGTQPGANATFSVGTDPNSGDALVTVTSATTAGGSSVAGNAQPIDIPLYLVPYGDGFKVGIEVSLNGGQTYEMEEFDTGASGFFSTYNAAWWSSYSTVSAKPVVMSYDSGNSYNAEVVSTDVTLQTTNGTPLSVDDVNVGLITLAEGKDFSPQAWNAGLTSPVTAPPLDGAFYGDFGMGLGDNGGVEAVLAQLGDDLSNGFIISLGTAPYGSTGQIGVLQLGLTQADIASFATSGTVLTMQGQNTLDRFPTSNEPTYAKTLGSGTITVTSGSAPPFNEPSTFVYDTGAPTLNIHEGTVITSGGLSGFVTSSGSGLTPGSTVALSAPGATSSGDGWSYGYAVTSANAGTSAVLSQKSGPGYVNAGIGAFFGENVMFDLADGELGFLACFTHGTAIRTPDGDRPVQDLRPGDSVTTVSGAARAIIWIGQRSLDCNRHPSPAAVWPVRIAADAFGPGLPSRDLHLSPDHALFLEGVLIPVKHLVNSDSIVQTKAGCVTYYHIELASHDVILAEALPAETYLDTGHRAAFAQAGSVIQAHPTFAPAPQDAMLRWEAQGYAPLVVTGPLLERVRRQLSHSPPPRRRRARRQVRRS
jgi:autotransporter passenger strand-loop-strand repeat protein